MAETQLYHVGCGRPLFTVEALHRGTMAMACPCGAPAPIMVRNLQAGPGDIYDMICSLPASLARVLQIGTRVKPHLEMYLGFSDFTCPAKDAWTTLLRESGLISFSDCDQPNCIRTPAEQRERIAKREARHRG